MHTLLALTVAAALAAEPVTPAVPEPPPLRPTDGWGWTIGGSIAGAAAFATAGLAGGILIERGNLTGGNGAGVALGSSVSAVSGLFIGGLIGWWARDHAGGRGGVAALMVHALAHLLVGGMFIALFNFTPGPTHRNDPAR